MPDQCNCLDPVCRGLLNRDRAVPRPMEASAAGRVTLIARVAAPLDRLIGTTLPIWGSAYGHDTVLYIP